MLLTIGIYVKLSPSISQVDQSLSFHTKLQNLDVLGTTIFISAVSCLLFVLQWGGENVEWQSSTAIGLFVGFVFLVGIFGFLQWKRGEHATIPTRILRKRSILMGALFLMPLGMSSLAVNMLFWTIPLFI